MWSLVVIGLLSGQTYFSAQAPQAGKPMSTDDALKAYRADLQGKRADILAKNITLTAAEAAKFWPEYTKFEAEQAAIVDEQLKALQSYAESYKTLDDAKALALVNANLNRDLQMHQLRTKWLAEFGKIVPVRTAARVIQIDRQLGLAHQLFLASELPLIY
jgi:hypothetical protein